ncbi:MAG: hypothetical protein KC591_02840 [Gemmatimonadetes bacterium]|nr:hypothetical protein [Gemmatimonadota bacterium]
MPWRFLLGTMMAGALGGASAEGAPAPVPDLALRKDSLTGGEGRWSVVVENLGDAASPATWIEATDRSSLGDDGTSPYRPVRGEDALIVDQVARPDGTVELRLFFDRATDPLRSGGSIRVDGGALRVGDGDAASDAPEATWDVVVPAEGAELRYVVVPTGRDPAEVEIRLAGEPVPITTGVGVFEDGVARFALDAAALPRARSSRVAVPPLAPGEKKRIDGTTDAERRVYLLVDPDDAIAEVREGNNATSADFTTPDVTLAALHLHSCFSEGSGSFDWQCLHAALSGFDLAWWTEHDWRVSCWDHLEHLGFEAGDPVVLRGAPPVEERLTGGDVFEGERMLSLPGGQWTIVSARRDRLAYAIASELELECAIRLEGDATLGIQLDLSVHPGERRRLVYEFVPLGRENEPMPDEPAGTVVLRRAWPTGGWKRATLRVTDDARDAWTNGLDDNLYELRFEARGDPSATASVDALDIRHEKCGADLQKVQVEFAKSYPNLRHEIGGEISSHRPHVTRYGGPSDLLDLDRGWQELMSADGRRGRGPDAGEDTVVQLVRRVHDGGGLASWCHPFGAGASVWSRDTWTDEYWDEVLAGNLGEVDLLEVGYRERSERRIADFLARWDACSAAGVAVPGLGVNDSHRVQWATFENDFGTWIAAPAEDVGRVKRALAAGHAFFGDPLRFGGTFDVLCSSARGGDILGGDGPRRFSIALRDAPPGSRVRFVTDGSPREWIPADRADGATLETGAGEVAWVRAECEDASGRPLAYTNPIWLDPHGDVHRPRDGRRPPGD